MVAAASATRTPMPGHRSPRSRRNTGLWVIIGVPILLVALFAWQLGSTLIKTDIIVRTAVAVSRVSLEQDPVGARVDFVVVDRVGADTTVAGELTVKVREPDGTVWRTTRAILPNDFITLPSTSLLQGRKGFSVLVPSTDWARAPRRGGAASVSVSVLPTDGIEPIGTVSEERFP